MLLWLLRHGNALPPSGTADAERQLSPEGRKQSRLIAGFLSRSHVPEIVLTSPFVRAVQTAEIVARGSGIRRQDETEFLLPGTSPAELLGMIQRRKEESLLLVGHEPLMSSFGSMLSSGHSSSVLRFSPCTLALLRLNGKPRPDGATLEILVPPEVLMRKRHISSEKYP